MLDEDDWAAEKSDTLSNEVVRYKGVSVGHLLVLMEGLLSGELVPEVHLVVCKHNLERAPAAKAGTTLLLTDSSRMLWRGTLGSAPDAIKVTFFEEDVTIKSREDWTVEDVCEYYVLPAMRETGSIYVDEVDEAQVGLPFQGAFVSQARKTKFVDLVHGLASYYRSEGKTMADTFVWLDLFGANQGLLTSEDQDDEVRREREALLSTGLHQAIRRFDERIVFFDSWVDPTPLKRAWCCWELYGALKSGRSIQLVFPQGEQQRFVSELREDYNRVIGFILKLDTREAQCHNPADKARIDAAVNTTVEGGFARLNAVILAQLRTWFVSSTEFAVQSEDEFALANEDDEETMMAHARLLFQASRLMIDQAFYETARGYLEQAVAITERFAGPDSIVMGEILAEGMGKILQLEDRPEEALEVLERAHRIILSHTDADDRDRRLVAVLDGMGTIYLGLGEYELAAENFNEARTRILAVYGPNYYGLTRIYNGQARIQLATNDLPKARYFAEKALSVADISLRKRHPVRAEVLKTLATVASRENNHRLAMRLLQQAQLIAEESLDSNHPSIANILTERALEASALKMYTDALELLQQAISIHETRGSEHLAYAKVRHNIGTVVDAAGDIGQAISCFEDAIRIKRKIFGDSPNLSLADSLENAATCYFKVRNYVMAAKRMSEVCEIYNATLGKAHPVSRKAAARLRVYTSYAK
ncbi:Kinesin light chain 3 [Hondaea fermentalgiana]|uniref:Kinesin light chain 3 n=1 Tax=Hondaea fermentalgiana TaxID=2315210 RepID=A0A2R5GLD8_9STRA|nr:Kinesin light chain 3 [Hondaea fermentalgiana]|eukprot:GBG28694.1 Kinesin light chain 3 [Hondaea fermentalgiana]